MGRNLERNLSWDDVRLFLALCRARTLSDAAAELGVDASTVSRRLSALEEILSTTLFERGRSGVHATEAALELMPVAEEIAAAMVRFTNRAEAFETDVSGHVRITCPPDTAEVFVAPLIPELLARHPRLRVELDAGVGLRDVARREADLALRVVKPDAGELVVKRLFSIDWTLAALPELARSLGTASRWDALPWIGWGERLRSVPAARWYAEHVGGDPHISSDSLRVQISLLTAGLGVALIPSRSVRHYGLEPVKIGRRLKKAAALWPRDDLYLVTHQALRRVPRVRATWDFLCEAS